MFDYFYGQSGEMFSYFRVPKILFRDIKFKDLSTDAKTLYGILLDRMGLSVKNGWLDEQGRVYIIFPVQEVMDTLGCADNKATKLFRELEKFCLRCRRGINHERVAEEAEDGRRQGGYRNALPSEKKPNHTDDPQKEKAEV
mgnify:CR=1 FL=1|jgi:hypothetical protein